MKSRSCLFIIICIFFNSCASLIKPSGDFESYTPPPKPDYSNENNWASLPTKKDKADLVPLNSGLKENQDSALVDVFFVHPTTYYSPFSWNAYMDNEKLNNFTDKSTIMHQASVFNGSSKIYAPRYRQATLYSFMDKKDNGQKALELAYSDVKEAFNYYLTHYNKGRPFIIASHSQGSRHTIRLLHDIIEKDTALYHRMVAAYIIGFKFKEHDVTIIQPCHSATETNCFVTWNTVVKGGKAEYFQSYVCTNPLSWTTDTTYQNADKNMGGVAYPFDKIDKNVTDAQVQNGVLVVNKPRYKGYPKVYGSSYHLVDYNLFYMNIRQNVKDRIKAYFGKK